MVRSLDTKREAESLTGHPNIGANSVRGLLGKQLYVSVRCQLQSKAPMATGLIWDAEKIMGV